MVAGVPGEGVDDGFPDAELRALRAGDEVTFRRVVAREHATLFRVARAHVRDDGAAADVVQETWLAAIRGLDGYEGRSSLRSWLIGIAVNQARRRGVRDDRLQPVADLAGAASDGPGGWPAERFRGPEDRWPGHWMTVPTDWSALPEERVTGAEVMAVARAAIDELPPRQRSVVLLRDVLGWTAAEVQDALDLSDGNERVLLHRGRSAVRRSLEGVLGRVNLDDVACRDLVERISDLIEGRLGPEEEAAIADHLASCPGCAAAVEQFRRTISVIGKLAEDDVQALEPDVVDGLLDALRRSRNR